MLHPSEILRPKTKTTGNFTIIFLLITTENSTLFLINPQKILKQVFQYWNSPFSNSYERQKHFAYKPFLSLNILDFNLFFFYFNFFYVKTATLPEKVTPIFPRNHPLRSCQAPPFWIFSRKLNPSTKPPPPPPVETYRGMHTMSVNLNLMTNLYEHHYSAFKSWKICHKTDASW